MENTEPRNPVRRTGHLNAQERTDHVIAWKRSGQSAQNYATAHGLRAGSLYRWNRQALVGDDGVALAKDSPFIPVRLSAPVIQTHSKLPQMTVRSGDFECLLDGATDIDMLVLLARRLKQEVFDV